jgi:hypothetical protein
MNPFIWKIWRLAWTYKGTNPLGWRQLCGRLWWRSMTVLELIDALSWIGAFAAALPVVWLAALLWRGRASVPWHVFIASLASLTIYCLIGSVIRRHGPYLTRPWVYAPVSLTEIRLDRVPPIDGKTLKACQDRTTAKFEQATADFIASAPGYTGLADAPASTPAATSAPEDDPLSEVRSFTRMSCALRRERSRGK